MEPIRLAIVGVKDYIDLIRDLVPSIPGAQITLHQGFGQDVIPIARQLQITGADAIVTGQANWEILKNLVEIPVVPLRITYEDLLAAIQKGLPYGRTMALAVASFGGLGFSNLQVLEELVHVTLAPATYSSHAELEARLIALKQSGISVVIGSTLASKLAGVYGMHGVVVYSLASNLQDAVDRAVAVVNVRRKEEARTEQFRTILDFTHDGIIASDQHGMINLCNVSALKILKLKREDVVGTSLAALFGKSQALVTGRPELGSVETINRVSVATNHTPVRIKNHLVGYVSTFQDVTRIQDLENIIRMETQAKGLHAKFTFADIIGASEVTRRTVAIARKYAESDFTVLIEGETGTGKEMFAQSIHNQSRRRSSPFVAVNCAALPENLLETELFGYDEGAFTGARKSGRKGLFELAHHGTIFLDEISSVSPGFQSKLLRVLQEREIMRVGSDKVIPVNVRIIAAANESLGLAVTDGRFRADLYFRLNVLTLKLPPLRQRKADLLEFFLQMVKETSPEAFQRLQSLAPALIRPLQSYHFPGNVRELRSIVERFLILVEWSRVEESDYVTALLREGISEIPLSPAADRVTVELKANLAETLAELERILITRTLQETNGDRSEAASKLGLSRTTLYRRLSSLGLDA